MNGYSAGDIVITRSGLWEVYQVTDTFVLLRNDSGRIHILDYKEMTEYCVRLVL